MYKQNRFDRAMNIIKFVRNVIQSESSWIKGPNSKYSRTRNEFLNFSTCDFLGLNSRFKTGTVNVTNSNGNVLSEYSNALSSLQNVFKTRISLFSDESSAYHSVLEKVISPNDFIVWDESSNTNLKIAIKHLKNIGVNSQSIPGNDLEKLSEIIVSKSSHRGRIWFAGQSIYPVPGKYIHLPALKRLMDQHNNLYLYLDDSYSLGWSGTNGEGVVYSEFPNLQRVIIVASLTKGFGANTGAIAISENETFFLEKLNSKGWSIPHLTQIGRISALLNSSETSSLQGQLKSRINYFHKALQGQLSCVSDRNLPLCFIPVRAPEMCHDICKMLIKEGFYVSSAVYPHSSQNQPGIIINLTLNHTENDILKMVEALKASYSKALKNITVLNNN
jgi:7-keto-8-aminopelargonate synthetase-like enzyme